MTLSILTRSGTLPRLVLLALVAGAIAPGSAHASDYVSGEVVVGYKTAAFAADAGSGLRAVGTASAQAPSVRVLRLPAGIGVRAAIARLRHDPRVAYAVPNFIAHADGAFIPDDRGRSHVRGGWEALQWNFLPGAGVNAPVAWTNLIAAGRPGGRGVTVAVLDTGVAYRNWGRYRISPDFGGTRFAAPYDFVAANRYPLDREGHGTFIAGIVAEATNNGFALTGLAYGATIMPVRVLDSAGTGDAATIARGIRYAVGHGAQIINLSLEFSPDVSAADIPDLISAIDHANRRGVVVVGAAGNEGGTALAYPARAHPVISVGATTRDRCLAVYSNGGKGLDLVAPGGGGDSALVSDPNCHPGRRLPGIYQMTFPNPSEPGRFGLPGGYYGTSMSAPQVAATAALVIASGVIGRHPAPDRVLARLEDTAQHLGGRWPNQDYGYGLLDAGAATAPLAHAGRRRH